MLHILCYTTMNCDRHAKILDSALIIIL